VYKCVGTALIADDALVAETFCCGLESDRFSDSEDDPCRALLRAMANFDQMRGARADLRCLLIDPQWTWPFADDHLWVGLGTPSSNPVTISLQSKQTPLTGAQYLSIVADLG
jgi:hypothetical protein